MAKVLTSIDSWTLHCVPLIECQRHKLSNFRVALAQERQGRAQEPHAMESFSEGRG